MQRSAARRACQTLRTHCPLLLLLRRPAAAAVGLMEDEEELDLEELAMEALDYVRCHDLLDPGQHKITSEQLYDGVLQQFVAPRDVNNFIVRAVWSPTATVFERRTNRRAPGGWGGVCDGCTAGRGCAAVG